MDGKTLLIVAVALAAGFHFYVSNEAPQASPAAAGVPADEWHSDIPSSWLNTRRSMQQYFTPYINEFGLHTTTAGFEIQITAPEAAQRGDSAIWGVSVNNEALGVGEKRIYTQPFEIQLSVNPWYQLSVGFGDPTLEALTSEENSKFVLLQVYATYLDDSTPAPFYVEVEGKNGIGRIKVYPAEEAARALNIKLNLISLVPVTNNTGTGIWHSDIEGSWLNENWTMKSYNINIVTYEFDAPAEGFEMFVNVPKTSYRKGASPIWNVYDSGGRKFAIGEKRLYTEPFEVELDVYPYPYGGLLLEPYTLNFSDPALKPVVSENNSKFILIQVYANYDDNSTAPMYVEVVPATEKSGLEGIGRIRIYPAECDENKIHFKVNFVSLVLKD